MRSTTKPLLACALLTLGAFAGCSTSPKGGTPERYDRVGQEIQCTNCTDTTHRYAVGIEIGGSGSCSGTLIAPNLVLTARHCVSQPSSQQIDCKTTTFPSAHYAANVFRVTTGSTLGAATTYNVSAVTIPSGTGTNGACGNDIALLTLSSSVSGITPATPLVQYSMTDHNKYSTTYTAIGFGNNNATTGAGTRRIMSNVNLTCIPGDSVVDCGDLSNANLDAKEFAGGNGVCSGDSGGGAYEQLSFNATPSSPVVFGIAVRAGEQNGNCVGSAYTRTDVWSNLIIQTAVAAASAGGYSPPAWTTPIPVGPDGGPTTKDGGSTTGDGGSSSLSALGTACGGPDECDSNVCAALGDGPQVCTQQCDAQNPCPSGFVCNGGYCFAGTAPEAGANQLTSGNSSSGCNIAPDPNQPQPWKGGVAALLVGLALAARRRR